MYDYYGNYRFLSTNSDTLNEVKVSVTHVHDFKRYVILVKIFVFQIYADNHYFRQNAGWMRVCFSVNDSSTFANYFDRYSVHFYRKIGI